MLKLAVRDTSDLLEFPIFPTNNMYHREIRGHITLRKKYGFTYIFETLKMFEKLGIKEAAVHTLGLKQAELNIIANIAHKNSITLNIENRRQGRTNTPEGLDKIINEMTKSVGQQGYEVGVALDVGHAMANGNLQEYISAFQTKIKAAHVYKIENDSGHHPFIGYDDFEEIAKTIAAIKSCDWWVAEVDDIQRISDWFLIFSLRNANYIRTTFGG